MTAEKSFQSVWLIMLVLSLLFLVWTSLVFAGGSAIKSVARISGVLYITTVLAFLVSNLFLKASLVVAGDVSTTMRLVADHALQYQLAVALDFVAMVAVMALVFSLFTILRPVSPYLALLALGWRIGEVVLQAGAKVPGYLLLTLSQSAAASPGGGIAGLESLAQILIAGSTRAVWLSWVFVSIGSIFNNALFYRSKAIPAALAIFGLASTALYTLGSVLALVIDLPESAAQGMMLPLVLFELSLGFHLAVFGIRERAPQRSATALARP